MMPRKATLLRLALVLALSPFAVEGFLRVFLGFPEPRIWIPNLDMRREIRDLVDSSARKTYAFGTNAFGLRGRQVLSREEAVLFLGSSTTECEGISDDSTWPAVAVATLRTRTGGKPVSLNGARSGMKLPHNILHFRAVAAQLEDAGIKVANVVLMPGAMDLQSFLSEPARDPAFASLEGPQRDALLAEAFPGLSRIENGAPVYKRNLTWLYLSRLRQQLFPGRKDESKSLDHFRKQDIRKASRRVGLPSGKAEAFDAFLAGYERDLREITGEGMRRGLPMTLVSQPIARAPSDSAILNSGILDTKWDTVTPARLENGLVTFLRQDEYIGMLDRVNAVTERVAAACGTCEFHDLAAEFPVRPGLFYDTFHLSEAGCAVAGTLIGHKIAENRGTGRP